MLPINFYDIIASKMFLMVFICLLSMVLAILYGLVKIGLFEDDK